MHDQRNEGNASLDLPRLLTPDELSTYLQVPIRTLDRWRLHNTGPPFIRLGRAVRYPSTELAVWIANQLRDQNGTAGSH